MSLSALAAFPENEEIKTAVAKHKDDVRILLGEQAMRPDLATALFILHEGVSSVWPIMGYSSIESANGVIKQIMEQSKNA